MPRGRNERPTKLSMTELLPELCHLEIMPDAENKTITSLLAKFVEMLSDYVVTPKKEIIVQEFRSCVTSE